jgi:hypothetical protein
MKTKNTSCENQTSPTLSSAAATLSEDAFYLIALAVLLKKMTYPEAMKDYVSPTKSVRLNKNIA